MTYFLRKHPPTGEEVSPDFQAGMQRMEEWYQDWIVWAEAYISMLEKRLSQRCDQCEHRHSECNNPQHD